MDGVFSAADGDRPPSHVDFRCGPPPHVCGSRRGKVPGTHRAPRTRRLGDHRGRSRPERSLVERLPCGRDDGVRSVQDSGRYTRPRRCLIPRKGLDLLLRAATDVLEGGKEVALHVDLDPSRKELAVDIALEAGGAIFETSRGEK